MEKSKSGIWITGASSGIGWAVAKEFSSVGCNVFASARRVNELEKLADEIGNAQVGVYPCNVASQANVNQTFKKISADYKIDCLVNNAGVKKNGGGTIINILSFAIEKTFINSSAYTASKMGLLGYSRVLREEVRDYNIRVMNIVPGATETPMWAREIREKEGSRMMNAESIARIMVSSFLHKDNVVTEEIVVRPIGGDI
ncbi:MAG: SDR family NAD(P)-dependent oxidoreductase [Ignavibacteriaceae bacterium]